MPAIDVSTSLVKIGAAVDGPFATIADLTTYDWSHTAADVTKTFVFGNPDAYVKAGDKDHSYGLAGLYSPEDTGGQNVLKTAYGAGSDVWLQVIPDGTDGWMEKCKVTEYSGSAARDGDYVEVAFQLEGVGTTVDVPLA